MEEEEGQQVNDDASKAASDEAELPEEAATNANDDDTSTTTAGAGTSYECIFCRRGFTTAQALGGHMNIHRRDRTRVMKSSPAASASVSESSYRYYHPYPMHKVRSIFNPPPVSDYPKSPACLPNEYGSRYARSCTKDDSRRMRELSHQELHLGLRLGLMNVVDGDGKGVGGGEEKKGDAEEEELDLELRLGH